MRRISLRARLALAFAARERLPLLTTRALICGTPDDTLSHYIDEATALAPNAISSTLPPTLESRADLYESFLRDP